jgi:hypothetical protein
VNYYLSRRRLYPAKPLRAADPTATELVNIDLSEPAWSLRSLLKNHLTITNGLEVQKSALDHILKAVNG